jgi:hypothetical protein
MVTVPSPEDSDPAGTPATRISLPAVQRINALLDEQRAVLSEAMRPATSMRC